QPIRLRDIAIAASTQADGQRLANSVHCREDGVTRIRLRLWIPVADYGVDERPVVMSDDAGISSDTTVSVRLVPQRDTAIRGTSVRERVQSECGCDHRQVRAGGQPCHHEFTD